jgi:hypothetical protein
LPTPTTATFTCLDMSANDRATSAENSGQDL